MQATSWYSEFGHLAGTGEPTDMLKYISFMLPNNLDSLACRSESEHPANSPTQDLELAKAI